MHFPRIAGDKGDDDEDDSGPTHHLPLVLTDPWASLSGTCAVFSWVFLDARGCKSGQGSGHGSDVGVGCWPDLARILIQIRANVFQLCLTKFRNAIIWIKYTNVQISTKRRNVEMSTFQRFGISTF